MKHDNSVFERTLFLGVDIGTESCKAVLMQAEVTPVHEDWKYTILAVEKVSSQGVIERSLIINIDRAVDIISELVQKVLKDQVGSVYTSFTIQGQPLQSKTNRVNNPFSKHERVIDKKDVALALEMASNAHLNANREYLHVIPRAFYINGDHLSSSPVGQMGASLDAEALLVSVPTELIKQILHCAQRISYPCNFICATPFATGEAVLTQKEKQEGALIIDIGSGMSSAALFRNRIPETMSMLPLGGVDITRDVSQVLNVPMDLAENIKTSYGFVDIEYMHMYSSDAVRIPLNQQILEIPLKKIYEIITARMLEILSLLKQQQGLGDVFPYPVVITGGSARMLGLKQLCEAVFKTNVRVALPWNWGGPYSEYRDPSYSSVIGLCIAGLQHYRVNGWASLIDNDKKEPKGNSFRQSVKKTYTNISEKFRGFLSLGDIS